MKPAGGLRRQWGAGARHVTIFKRLALERRRPKSRKRAVRIGSGKPATSDDIRNQDRREFPGLALVELRH
jgi:hypothetical protein